MGEVPALDGGVPLERESLVIGGQDPVGTDEAAGRTQLVGVLGEDQVPPGTRAAGEVDEGPQTVVGGGQLLLDARDALGEVGPSRAEGAEQPFAVEMGQVACGAVEAAS